ncbi:MAG TPA: LysM peptidoglycan-binding domain-containing protein, partial [Stellaceae bacterium]|nr:LysM peptidoglycan-binding domain-containing protein [Stellaceae bacterium]
MRHGYIARRGRRAAAVALLLGLPLYACARLGPPAPFVVGEPPMPDAAAAPQFTAAGPAQITVRPGQSLDGIARAYRVSPRAVIAANHLHPPYRLEAGWTLVIPQGGISRPPAARVAAAAAPPRPAPEAAASR